MTGAAGYFATELVAQLLESGKYRVRGTVRSLAMERLSRKHPLRMLQGADARLELYEANLMESGSFDNCMAGAKYVFHTASPFFTEGITDGKAQLIDPAVNGTCNVLRSAVKAGVVVCVCVWLRAPAVCPACG